MTTLEEIASRASPYLDLLEREEPAPVFNNAWIEYWRRKVEVYERHWYGDVRVDLPQDGERHNVVLTTDRDGNVLRFIDGIYQSPPAVTGPALQLSEEASYEQWIGLLYACAVFRGVLEHPQRWA